MSQKKDREPRFGIVSPLSLQGVLFGLRRTDARPARIQGSTTAAFLCSSNAAGRDVRERRLAKFRQNVARFRLYRLRFLQENMRFAAFFKIYQILKLNFLEFNKILQIFRHLQFFC